MSFTSVSAWFIQSPWMLLALLSTLIPICIHLFSKSKGKLIPFGNIKLLQISKPVQMNEIRLVERLLLLSRLLLLISCVLFLAQLYYDDRLSNSVGSEGNILVTHDWLNHASEAELNSLALKAKVGVVYLISKRSVRLTDSAILAWPDSQNEKLSNQSQQNTWLAVKNYLNSLPRETQVTVYSTNQLSQFNGDIVSLPSNLDWVIKKLPSDSVAKLSTKAISVLIFTDVDRKEDLQYLHSALTIIQASKLQNLTFEISKFTADEYFNQEKATKKPSYDWIFYLSSTPVYPAILHEVQQGAKLFIDAKQPIKKIMSPLLVENTQANSYLLAPFSLSIASQPRLNIDLSDEFTPAGRGDVLWQGSGVTNDTSHVVLERYEYNLGEIFSFYSRFNPKWNQLVMQLQFPQVLLSLLLTDSLQNYQGQQQLTDDQIENSLTSKAKTKSHSAILAQHFKAPLFDHILLFLIFLFWSIERILSECKRENKSRNIHSSISLSSEVNKNG